MAMLMDCMAAIPSAEVRRARAFITATEKAKKSPPIKPHPSAVIIVTVKSKLSEIDIRPLANYRAVVCNRQARHINLNDKRLICRVLFRELKPVLLQSLFQFYQAVLIDFEEAATWPIKVKDNGERESYQH